MIQKIQGLTNPQGPSRVNIPSNYNSMNEFLVKPKVFISNGFYC